MIERQDLILFNLFNFIYQLQALLNALSRYV